MREASPSGSPCVSRLAQAIDPRALIATWPDRYPAFLESADGEGRNARYDILFRAGGEHLSLDSSGALSGNYAEFDPGKSFLQNLDIWHAHEKQSGGHDALPFYGGWFVYLGYELAREVEPGLRLPPSRQSQMPDALAIRCDGAIIHDRQTSHWYVVAESAAVACSILSDTEAAHFDAQVDTGLFERIHVEEATPERFLLSVEKIREYIHAGDVFQVNLSREWSAKLPAGIADMDIYTRLRSANPAPFAGYLHWRHASVFSSSPERLVEVRGPKVQTRPIAGTRPRSRLLGSDDSEKGALVTHPKERAEHIMLIDLERNDLGRVCQPGTVEVDELMALESYAHVHHIVSNVRGVLRHDISAGDVIRAVFPGGTITGCPKVRCMEIIAELEESGRGYYTGAMGYLDRNGDLDMNILIRCMLRENDSVYFRTGAGIVADSVPDNELNETRAKARGLIKALDIDA